MFQKARIIGGGVKNIQRLSLAIRAVQPRHKPFVQPASSRSPSITRRSFTTMAMQDPAVARFSQVPWAASLINDPQWIPRSTSSRRPKATGEDTFFGETLRTDRTIPAVLTLRPVREDQDDQPYKEIATIMELGNGLNGFPQIAHGGLVATLLDEVCGILVTLNLEKRNERLKSLGRPGTNAQTDYFTAYLNTNYKKPLPTPGVILCRAKIERQDGRKLYIRATAEDGRGTVFTMAEGMFVEVTTRL